MEKLEQRRISAPHWLSGSLARRLRETLRSACCWLRSHQAKEGCWRDFWTPAGISDEWVTGYAGAALARSPDADSRACALSAWQYLTWATRPDGGWGYSGGVPSDADSTTWALILGERLGEGSSTAADGARRFLERACIAGGVATYAETTAIKRFVAASLDADFSGWSQAHPCVTGASAQTQALRARLIADVIRSQRPDGSWKGYWWFEEAYATAMSVEALAEHRSSAARAAIERACRWARHRVETGAEVSPFSAALLASILLRDPAAAPEIARCAAQLIESQESDGHWRGCARLRVPSPSDLAPDSIRSWTRWLGAGRTFAVFSLDQFSVFTTATAYSAVAALLAEPVR